MLLLNNLRYLISKNSTRLKIEKSDNDVKEDRLVNRLKDTKRLGRKEILVGNKIIPQMDSVRVVGHSYK